MDLQADEFATVNLSPEKSLVNKERSDRQCPLGEKCFKGLTLALLSLFINLQIDELVNKKCALARFICNKGRCLFGR